MAGGRELLILGKSTPRRSVWATLHNILLTLALNVEQLLLFKTLMTQTVNEKLQKL